MSSLRMLGLSLVSGVLLSACVNNPVMMTPNGVSLVNPWHANPPPITNANAAPVSYVDVYKYQGSRQCENGGVTLAEMQTQLQMTGVNVLSGSCGVDGMVYPAFCGGADGKINIFSIPSQNAPQAQAQGFTLLTQLPNAQRVQCHNPSPSIPPSMTPQPLSANGQPFVPYTGGNNSSYYSYH